MSQAKGPTRQQRANRTHQLRGRGHTWEQIADVWAGDYPQVGPRVAIRWAHNLTHQDVADQWNALDPGDAPMSKSRIYEFEVWPNRGRRPSVASLRMLARIYQTSARYLLTGDEYALYEKDSRAVIADIDFRYMDANHRFDSEDSRREDGHIGLPRSLALVAGGGDAVTAFTINSYSIGKLAFGEAAIGDKEMINMAANRARKFVLGIGEGTIASDAIEQIHDDLRGISSVYARQPLSEFLGDLVNIQDVIFSLLERRQQPAHARDLYFLAGVNSGLLAKASHDLSNPQAAMTQARTAFLCAENADHNGLRAWLRGLQSLIAYWASRYTEAIRYAKQGAEFADRARNTCMVWVAMNEARSWAALGNTNETVRSIRRAEDAWSGVEPDDMDNLGGISTFTRPRQLYYAADALAWLPGEAQQAETYSADAVAEYSDSNRPEWAFGDQAGSHSDLAISRLQRGEIEGASEALSPVLELPSGQRINGVVRSVEKVQRTLIKTPDNTKARDLHERIEVFMRTPAHSISH